MIYEINTAVWLDELSQTAGRRVTLADVAACDWTRPPGRCGCGLVDGRVGTEPAGLALAAGNAELQASFRDALPGLRPEDAIGSPYCVRRYVVDAAFGGREPWPLPAPRWLHEAHD